MEAYDPALAEVVLFGGYSPYSHAIGLKDTWVFKNGKWTDITGNLTRSPARRWGAGLAYDPGLKALILFGGHSDSTFYNDTWTFNATGWHRYPTSGAPSPRSGFGMTYDPALGEMVLYGGSYGPLPYGPWTLYDSTYALARHTWSNLTSTLGLNPGPRFNMFLTYDPSIGGVVAFGGANLSASGAFVFTYATWVIRTTGWVRITTSRAPVPGTESGGLSWFAGCHCVVFFGAGNPAPLGNQTWTFRGGVWTNRTGSLPIAPEARGNLMLADDTADGYLVLFGGVEAPPYYNNYCDNTWTFR